MTEPVSKRHVSKHNFISSRMRSLGSQDVTIIHNEGRDDEERVVTTAHIQANSGFFELDTPIYNGDIVDVGADPRDGQRDRRLVVNLKLNQAAAIRGMAHTHVEWGQAPAPRVAAVRRLTFENLHSDVRQAAGDLYADGHHRAAISEAFKSLEVRVRDLTDIPKSGSQLMGDAFAFKSGIPPIDVSTEPGQSGLDEKEGFAFLFRGSMLGIRNPGAHELFKPADAHEALEYLAFASLLHRRIDQASVTPKSVSEGT